MEREIILNTFKKYLKNTRSVVSIELSEEMLKQTYKKTAQYDWTNIFLLKEKATKIIKKWHNQFAENKGLKGVDAVFCDLGFSSLLDWQSIYDNLFSILKLNGCIVIMY